MKRIALLLAAVGLGSGCIVETSTNEGDAVVYWSFWNSDQLGDFGSYSATSTSVCAAAAVEEIEITLTSPAGDVLAPVSGGCITGNDVPGAAFTNLEAGTWEYYIAGYRGGTLVFEDSYWFDVDDGFTTDVDAYMQAIYYDLVIDYAVETCEAGDSIEFDLYDTDLVAPVYSTYLGTTNPPVAVPCLASGIMVIPSIPGGGYESSEWVQYDATNFEVGWSDCAPTWTQSSFASKTILVDVVSSPVGGFCAQ